MQKWLKHGLIDGLVISIVSYFIFWGATNQVKYVLLGFVIGFLIGCFIISKVKKENNPQTRLWLQYGLLFVQGVFALCAASIIIFYIGHKSIDEGVMVMFKIFFFTVISIIPAFIVGALIGKYKEKHKKL